MSKSNPMSKNEGKSAPTIPLSNTHTAVSDFNVAATLPPTVYHKNSTLLPL